MSLRVLLADESSTIKKVFQIALQDFAVDVKAVSSGEDVVPVAEEFKPDIIFADILLQKHSGYDVSQEIKKNANLSHTPIVLMWSGFMELDDSRVAESGADGKIEKPFEVDQLREIVQRHVPKTQSQIISKYLSFPEMPEFAQEEAQKAKNAKPAGSPANDIIAMPGSTSDEEIVDLSSDVNESASDWDMDSFTPIEEFEGDEIQTQSDVQAETLEADALELDEFQQVPLTNKRADNTPPPQMAEDDNQWVQKDLSQFQVNENVLFDDSPPVSFDADEEEIEIQNESSISEPRDISENTQKAAHTHASEGLEIESLDDVETFNLFDPPPNFIERRKRPSVSKKDIEEIVTKHIDEALENTIRREAAKIIEDVVWKVVPEITKQIVEKELKRLLEEDDEI